MTCSNCPSCGALAYPDSEDEKQKAENNESNYLYEAIFTCPECGTRWKAVETTIKRVARVET